MNTYLQQIQEHIHAGCPLEEAEALALLALPEDQVDWLLTLADSYSRTTFENQGLIFGQIGLDAQGCAANCKFCSLALDWFQGQPQIKSVAEVVSQAKTMVVTGCHEIFLMCTEAFDTKLFLDYGRAVAQVLPQGMRLVANTGDFDLPYAKAMRDAGFTGAYHVHRLGEGTDTTLLPQRRLDTLQAIKDSGLELYYCVEPIGPEHSDEQLVTEMLRTRTYPAPVMPVMKRVCVAGTPLAHLGEVTNQRMAQICAVTTLVARPSRAMCIHEPDSASLLAGANQLYGECGSNPRDLAPETSLGRSFTVERARTMLQEAHWN